MKILANIILILFIAFLATPTVVSVIENDADVSLAYSFSEEEVNKEVKEVPATLQHILHITFVPVTPKTTAIKSMFLQKHNNVFEEIFSPPPENV